MLHLAAFIYDSSELEILDNGEERGLELKWIWKMGNRKKEQKRNYNFVSKTCIILTMPLKDKGRPSYFCPQLWKSNWAVPTTINKLNRQTVMKKLLLDFGKFQTWLSDAQIVHGDLVELKSKVEFGITKWLQFVKRSKDKGTVQRRRSSRNLHRAPPSLFPPRFWSIVDK